MISCLECPHNVTISPQNTVPKLGEVYTCTAMSYPSPANYTWFNSSGVVVSTHSTVTVDKVGTFSLTCMATVLVGGRTCNENNTISGTVIGRETTCVFSVILLSLSLTIFAQAILTQPLRVLKNIVRNSYFLFKNCNTDNLSVHVTVR